MGFSRLQLQANIKPLRESLRETNENFITLYRNL